MSRARPTLLELGRGVLQGELLGLVDGDLDEEPGGGADGGEGGEDEFWALGRHEGREVEGDGGMGGELGAEGDGHRG